MIRHALAAFTGALLVLATLIGPAAEAASDRGGYRPAQPAATASRARRPWRPRWWPKALSAGAGVPGVIIRLGQQRLYVHDGRKGWTWFYISTGARFPTPQGTYRIVTKVRNPTWSYRGQTVPGGTRANPLGVVWLGLGMPRWWTGAPIGMHGTNAPWLIGQPASKGCIRLRNADALRLYRMVPLGCRVYIVP
jgi:lipoprotein-anchoring transpeptidase ErfK/SrfK